MRVVVIGGLGNFGARICRRLVQEPGFEIIATSRAARSAIASGGLATAALDLDSQRFAAELALLAPDLVIHCAGPFQGQDYRVALASLACGAHYIDIADGRDFVAGFVNAVGAAAERAQRFAITGASTLPALSSAVINSLKPSFAALDTIDIVIAPGQHAPRGAATMAGVLGYAGRPLQWWRNGAWRVAYGWQELKREHFSFGTRWAAACDVPDLELLPARIPGVQTVTFRAALEVAMQHYALWLIAALRRIGLPIPMTRWAGWFDRIGNWLNGLGSDTGGMIVRVVGTDGSGAALGRTWELKAGQNHGPEIPCMAAVILAILCRQERRDSEESPDSADSHGSQGSQGSYVGQKKALRPGASVCLGTLELREFEKEFARWDISTTVKDAQG